MDLMTSDDYPAYETAILHAYGETVTPPRTGKPGRPKAPYQAPPPGLTYATVTKRREKGRVVEVGTRVVFGTIAAVLLALGLSKVSRAINTAFVERQNGTDRHRNARKARKTYRFSKDWRYHEAVTYLTLYSYNFCWPVRTLAVKDDEGRRRETEPGDGGGADRPRLVDVRMVVTPRRATLLSHEADSAEQTHFFGSPAESVGA